MWVGEIGRSSERKACQYIHNITLPEHPDECNTSPKGNRNSMVFLVEASAKPMVFLRQWPVAITGNQTESNQNVQVTK